MFFNLIGGIFGLGKFFIDPGLILITIALVLVNFLLISFLKAETVLTS